MRCVQHDLFVAGPLGLWIGFEVWRCFSHSDSLVHLLWSLVSRHAMHWILACWPSQKFPFAIIGLNCFNLDFQEWITTTPPSQKPPIELWIFSATRFSTNTSAGHMALPLHWLSQLWFGITVSRHRWNPCTDGRMKSERSWAPAFGQGELHGEPMGTICVWAY